MKSEIIGQSDEPTSEMRRNCQSMWTRKQDPCEKCEKVHRLDRYIGQVEEAARAKNAKLCRTAARLIK